MRILPPGQRKRRKKHINKRTQEKKTTGISAMEIGKCRYKWDSEIYLLSEALLIRWTLANNEAWVEGLASLSEFWLTLLSLTTRNSWLIPASRAESVINYKETRITYSIDTLSHLKFVLYPTLGIFTNIQE